MFSYTIIGLGLSLGYNYITTTGEYLACDAIEGFTYLHLLLLLVLCTCGVSGGGTGGGSRWVECVLMYGGRT